LPRAAKGLAVAVEHLVERRGLELGREHELEQQRVAQLQRHERLAQPAVEEPPARLGGGVDLAIGLAVARLAMRDHEPLALERMQLSIDLALRDAPERAHRAVEALLERVARGGLELEEPEDRSSK